MANEVIKDVLPTAPSPTTTSFIEIAVMVKLRVYCSKHHGGWGCLVGWPLLVVSSVQHIGAFETLLHVWQSALFHHKDTETIKLAI